MSGTGTLPQGNVVADSKDFPRLVFAAPYHTTVAIAEIIEPSVQEAVEGMLPSLVPPYVTQAANEAVATQAVLLSGSTMTGPLFLSPTMPTQPSQAATKAFVETMLSTAGVPEVPAVPSGQVWGRMVGQWTPLPTNTNFLPLSGGTMLGAINMNGNSVINLPAVPNLPNGAAPAQWVLNNIAASTLYQGTWDVVNNQPDLTQSATHQNKFTWIAVTASTSGTVVSAPVPGLQGLTIFNGDTIIYSAMVGQFQAIHGGGLTLDEANALFVALAGSTMTGPLMLSRDPVNAMEAATREWVLANTAFPEAPNDGQAYGRNGLAHSWVPTLPIAGGVLAGALTLNGNATTSLNPVPLQQLTSTLGNYVPLAGGVSITGAITMSGGPANLTLNSNAASALQAVPLQQLTSTLAAYAPINSPTFTGTVTIPAGASIAGYLPLTSGTLTGDLTLFKASPALVLNTTAAGQQRNLFGQTAGATRWQINLGDTVAETGGNAGANFQIARYSDAGGYLDSPITIARATGAVSIPNLTAAPGAATNVGRNLIHNALFNVQQRGVGAWSTGGYTADRWLAAITADTSSVSILAATDAVRTQVGDEAVQSVLQIAFTGSATAGASTILAQRMENLRRFSGKTVILSFWANAGSVLTLAPYYQQVFGTGGSPSAAVTTNASTVSIPANAWTRFSVTTAIPSAAGKTFGTNAGSDWFQLGFIFSQGTPGPTQSGTIQLWGVQLEIAQPGQTQPTPLEKIEYGDDLKHCQRFFQTSWIYAGAYAGAASTTCAIPISFPVVMRAAPTLVATSDTSTGAVGARTVGNLQQLGAIVSAQSSAAGAWLFNVLFTASADL